MKSFKVTPVIILLLYSLIINNAPLVASLNSNDPIEIYFTKDSLKIQSWFFQSTKEESYPIVILIHGYPDFDKDVLRLGEYLSSKCYNVLCPNFIGTHKSEGIWDPVSSLQSVKAAIDYINSEEFNNEYSVNTKEKIIIGHSFGGGMALLGSLYDSSITQVISIAGGDLGVMFNQMVSDPEYKKSHAQYLDWAISDSTISRGLGGKITHELYGETLRDDFNLKDYCDRFAQKNILLIGGWYDDAIKVEYHLIPLYRCIQESSIKRLNIKIFETDHSFESVNNQLKEVILNWIKD